MRRTRRATQWLKAEGLDADAAVSPVNGTSWKSRYFTVEIEPGHAFSFWAWADPLKGKPVARQK